MTIFANNFHEYIDLFVGTRITKSKYINQLNYIDYNDNSCA
jgi:hypothetical protein